MKKLKSLMVGGLALGLAVALVAGAFAPATAEAKGKVLKQIRIAVLYSITGALAPAGGLAEYRASKLLIDSINEKGGVLGEWEIIPFYADNQSSPDVGSREDDYCAQRGCCYGFLLQCYCHTRCAHMREI